MTASRIRAPIPAGARARHLALFHTPSVAPVDHGEWVDCHDCGADVIALGEVYMVHDDVWPVEPDGMLCVGCLEARIGRGLRARDFTACPLNRLPGDSPRLSRAKGLA